MGSYLNNVAAKALGQSVALRPRVLSLFEPPPALRSARLAPFPSLKADPDTRLDSGDSAAPQHDWWSRGRMSRRETPVASADGEQNAGERQAHDSDQATVSRITGHKRRQPVSIEPAALSRDETDGVAHAPEGPAPAKPRITPAAAPRTEKVRSDAIEPSKGTDTGIASQLRRASPDAESRSDATSRKEDRRDPEQSVSARPEVRSVAAPERAEVAAHSLRPAPKTPTFPRADARDAEEKERGFSVSVVIGRVNVQAVLPQPAAFRLAHSSPAPLLTLEQYLKQRGGHS